MLRDQLIADKEAMVLMEKTLDKALAYSLGMLKDAPLGIRFGYNNKWQKTVLLVPFSFEEAAPVIGALARSCRWRLCATLFPQRSAINAPPFGTQRGIAYV